MKIKLNKYINIVHIYILIKSNIYIYIGIVILLYRNMLNYNIISLFIINFFIYILYYNINLYYKNNIYY